jgi:hypothetical protein
MGRVWSRDVRPRDGARCRTCGADVEVPDVAVPVVAVPDVEVQVVEVQVVEVQVVEVQVVEVQVVEVQDVRSRMWTRDQRCSPRGPVLD